MRPPVSKRMLTIGTSEYLLHNFTGVTASCDFYYDGMESLKYNIEQSLEMLGIIRSQFNPIKAELENI